MNVYLRKKTVCVTGMSMLRDDALILETLDQSLKELALRYTDVYGTNNLKIEMDIRRSPESVKIKISDFRNI